MASRAPVFPALALALACSACLASTLVDERERAPAVPAELAAWRPAGTADLDGLFESIAIEGEAAAAVWRIYYHFSPGGSYTGAALLVAGEHPEFQTLSGRWSLDGEMLTLGEDEPARASVAGDRLRLESARGEVAVLRRVLLE